MIAPSTPPTPPPRPRFPLTLASLAPGDLIPVADPPAKRKRLTRTRTGCRECRRLHVKCAEGGLLPSGGKGPCRRCWSTDQTCWYPFPAGGYPNSRKRRTGERAKRNVELEERSWERAEDVGVWVGSSPSCDSGSAASVSRERTVSGSPTARADSGDVQPILGPVAAVSAVAAIVSAAPTPWSIANSVSAVTQHVFDSAPWFSGATTTSPELPPDLLSLLFTPSAPLQTFTLASFSSSPEDRAAVSYFETTGCNDITAAPCPRDNWIHAQLFPHVLGLLSTDSPMGGYTRLALLQISYTHRGNMEADEDRSAVFRAKACHARERGTCALLRAKARSKDWRTEEYLIGFFIRCIADVLSSGRIDVHDVAYDFPTSPLYGSLRDLIATYGIVQFACSPFTAESAPFELVEAPAQGHDWTAAAFGCSRGALRLLSRVSSMVARRVAILRKGDDGASALLTAEASALVRQLEMPDWDASSSRVHRGTMVMRYALRTMLLCEILYTNLDDPRIKANRDAAHELVADCDPSSMTGFQWQLAVLAIYTRELAARERMASLLRLALGMGFGPNYRGTLDVLEVCWDVLDTNGKYEHGIAPWREAMHALGRNLWV